MRLQWPGSKKASEKPTTQLPVQATKDEHSPNSPRPLWIPFFLRRANLILFICVFLAIGIALGALYGVSVRNSGICDTNTKYYYLWTYGPTAALWAQVEYRSKQMMPWNLMAQKPQPVEKSLFLDYTDPMNVISLFTSAKAKHFVVTAAIAGTFFIKLITVLSSGLFAATSTTVRRNNSPLTARNTFYSNPDAGISGGPIAEVYGNIVYGLDFREGTTPLYAYQSFESSSESYTSATAEVDVFSAGLTCEVAKTFNVQPGMYMLAWKNPLLDLDPILVEAEMGDASVTFSTDTCNDVMVSVLETQSMGWNGTACSNIEDEDDAFRFVVIFGNWTTTYQPLKRDFTEMSAEENSSDSQSNNDVSTQDINASADDSLVSIDDPSTSNNDQNVSIDDPSVSTDDTSLSVKAPEASTAMPNIINNGQGASPSTSTSSPSASSTSTADDGSGGLTAANFTLAETSFHPTVALACKPHYGIQRASVTLWKTENGTWSPNISIHDNGNASRIRGVSEWTVTKAFAQSIYQSKEVLSIDLGDLLEVANPDGDVTVDSFALQDGLTKLYQSVSAQYARSYLMKSAQESLSGEVVSKKSRLQVRTISFAVIEAMLVLLIGIAGYLYLKSPTITASRDPASIGGLSTILARSPELMTNIECLGSHGHQEIRDQLQHREFKTLDQSDSSSAFAITVSGTSDTESAGPAPLTEDKIKWWRPFAVSIVGRILIAIAPIAVVIALTLLLARSQDKNGISTIDTSLAVHYAWTYVPVLVMVGVQLLFGMLDYAIKLFNPYHNLRVGTAPSRTSIMENHLAKLGLHALFVAIGKLQYTVVAAGFAMMLASFLTIVTSGLFYTEYVTTHQDVQVQRLDSWNFARAIDDGSNASSVWTEEGTKEANLVLAYNLTDPTWTYDQFAFPKLQIKADESAPKNASELQIRVPALRAIANCTTTFPPGIGIDLAIHGVNDLFEAKDNPHWKGTGLFAHWESLGDYGETIIISTGRVVDKNVTELSRFSCRPYIEQVDVNATFSLPGYTFSDKKPPVPDNSTRTILYPIMHGNLDGGTKIANPGIGNLSNEDLFGPFGIVVHGRDGIPIDELVGDANKVRLIDAMKPVYSRLVAQLLNFRRGSPDDAIDIKGIATSTDTLRLKQSAISTHILQGMLLAMFICSAITFIIMDTRKLLPKNPCSIAAVASLLAGSDLMTNDIIPPGAEWMGDRELEKKVFKGLLFRLGWWQDEDEPGASRFGIDIGKARGNA